MGCGPSSAANSVISVSEAPSATTTLSTQRTLNSKPVLKPIPRKNDDSNPNTNNNNKTNNVKSATSADTAISETRSSPNSALSEQRDTLSSHSEDSGYLDHEYKNVITEKSKPELVKKIEKEFTERTLDLTLNGRSCPTLYTDEEKKRMEQVEEAKALEMLKNNGLVQKSITKNENYARFEIIDEKLSLDNQSLNQAGSGLAPLKRIPPRFDRNSEKNTLTPEQIKKKLEEAQERKNQFIASKISAANTEEKSKLVPIREDLQLKLTPDSSVQQRQKKLLDIRDKIRAKQAAESSTPRTPRTEELMNELDKFRSKTPSTFKAVFD